MSNELSILSKGNILSNIHLERPYMTLADFLRREEETLGIVALATKTGVAHTSLRKIINGDYKRDIETFIRIADVYNMPLWKVMEMAEYDLGLSADQTAAQVASLIKSIPAYAPVLERLAGLDPRDLAAIVVHLSALMDAQHRISNQNPE